MDPIEPAPPPPNITWTGDDATPRWMWRRPLLGWALLVVVVIVVFGLLNVFGMQIYDALVPLIHG